ncbi:MAG: aldo/keto reductase [Deltaproteobacteria bacterium]|nr:aldo/keto reductase [Deltaproteobacteria bacterium]
MSTPLTRRDFLALAATVPLVGAAAPIAAAAVPTFRSLGRTGLRVSEVGMGVMLTSDPAHVRAAFDAGVNYFDTARAYMGGRNEETLAEGLKGRRQDAVVATKCHVLGRKALVVATAEQSLKALRTDVIDVFQLHGLSSRDQVLLPDHLEAVEELRKAGKIRFAGVTTHSNMPQVLSAAVEAKVYDTVLTTFNFQVGEDMVEAARTAAAAGVGVIAMKVMTGGYSMRPAPGLNPYQSALRWVLQHSFVGTAIPSMTTYEQVRENTGVMGTQHTWRDKAALRLYALAVGDRYCRGCGACAGQCADGADVPTALRALMYAEGYGRLDLARETLVGVSLPCGSCAGCSVTCRKGVEVSERMRRAAQLREVGVG